MRTDTEVDITAMRERLVKAWDAVTDMCSGSRQWRMTIPVDMDRDHDMVIGKALSDLELLLNRMERR